MTQPKVDAKYLEVVYSMGKSLELKEVPLLLMSDGEQMSFTQQVTGLIGGLVVFSAAADVERQILKSFGDATYLFLGIEEPMDKSVQDIVFYYLNTRDIMEPRSDTILQHQFSSHPIHDDHRLILLMSKDVFSGHDQRIQRRLRELCTVNARLTRS